VVEEPEIIEEEEVPLAEVPVTGSTLLLSLAAAALSGIGLIATRKKSK